MNSITSRLRNDAAICERAKLPNGAVVIWAESMRAGADEIDRLQANYDEWADRDLLKAKADKADALAESFGEVLAGYDDGSIWLSEDEYTDAKIALTNWEDGK